MFLFFSFFFDFDAMSHVCFLYFIDLFGDETKRPVGTVGYTDSAFGATMYFSPFNAAKENIRRFLWSYKMQHTVFHGPLSILQETG